MGADRGGGWHRETVEIDRAGYRRTFRETVGCDGGEGDDCLHESSDMCRYIRRIGGVKA